MSGVSEISRALRWWLLSTGVQSFLFAAGGILHFFFAPKHEEFVWFIISPPLGFTAALWCVAWVIIPMLRERLAVSQAYLGDGPRLRTSQLRPIAGVDAYGWWEDFPKRPLRNVAHERNEHEMEATITPMILGFCLGACLWPVSWLSFGLFTGFICLFAGLVHSMTERPHPGVDVKTIVGAQGWREARIVNTSDGALSFVVTSRREPSSDEEFLIAIVPWAAVTGFAADKYARTFMRADEQIFERDWSVVMMSPEVGHPVLVTESLNGDGHVYELVTELTARFGPAARSAYEQLLERKRAGYIGAEPSPKIQSQPVSGGVPRKL